MKAMSKAVSLLAISVALTLSGSHVFAGTGSPGQVKTSGTSAAPSGLGTGGSKYIGPPRPSTGTCRGSSCVYCRGGGSKTCYPWYNPPGATLPPCRGGHMGPNGVMIQCQ
jgi:hypothetical protein